MDRSLADTIRGVLESTALTVTCHPDDLAATLEAVGELGLPLLVRVRPSMFVHRGSVYVWFGHPAEC